MKAAELALNALDDSPLDIITNRNYSRPEVIMKVKKTFYSRKVGDDYNPLIHVDYPKSRADQLSYSPTAKLVDQMFKTGQMVQSSKQAYDFSDGKDDGRDVPFDRQRGLDYPEISQAMLENEQKLHEHEKNLSEVSAKKKSEKKSKQDGQSANDNGGSAASDGGSGGSGSTAKD